MVSYKALHTFPKTYKMLVKVFKILIYLFWRQTLANINMVQHYMQASRLLSQYNCNFAFPLNVSYYNHAITQPARLRGETQQPQRATCHI